MLDNLSVGGTKPFIQLSNTICGEVTWSSSLEGKLLTFIDASFSDKEQREAVKSIVKGIIRDYYRESNSIIDKILNDFTCEFEGDEVEYTTFYSPNGQFDIKEILKKDNLNVIRHFNKK